MPSKLPIISLHIGAHKTASTHLQKVLHDNRALLSDEGIRCLGPKYLRKSGCSLPSLFGLSWSDTDAPKRTPHEQLRHLAKGNKQLVFSEENFVGTIFDEKRKVRLPLYPKGAERVAELASAWAPAKVQLFVAVRNPASYLASAYSQGLMSGRYFGPRTFRAGNDWRNVDWAGYIDRLRSIDVLGQIFVWRQEDYQDCQRPIMRRLLRWKVGRKIEIVTDRVNERLSSAAVRQTLQWAQDNETGKLAERARKLFPVNDDNKPFNLYAPSTLASAQAIYDAQMAQIEALDGVTVLHPPAPRAQGLKRSDKTVT